MSHTNNQQYLEESLTTFEEAVSQRNWSEAQEVINLLQDNGFSEYKLLSRKLLDAQEDPTVPVYVPIEDSEAPYITPEEDEIRVTRPTEDEFTREGDDTFPTTIY